MIELFLILIFVSVLIAFLIGSLIVLGALLDTYSNERW